ncbi:MAG: DinB family protein [Flavobacteriia bacterium]|nr:DinB family protein [Flavobacteriia bacterium]
MKTFIETFIEELKMEGESTKKLLTLIPKEKLDWQPHTKSMTLKALATHISEIPGWIKIGVTTSEINFADNPYPPKDCNSAEEFLDYIDEMILISQNELGKVSDAILTETWVMRNAEIIYAEMSKWEVIRHSFNQLIHHRAQLGVYLRLLDIPLPGVYGPTADELPH